MRQDTEFYHKYNSSEIMQRINEDTNVSCANRIHSWLVDTYYV
jgi:hypothetical protein